MTADRRGTASSPASATLYNIGDFGATLGGYIIKDKLWFFVGVAARLPALLLHPVGSPSSASTSRTRCSTRGNQVYDPIANSDQRRFG